MLHRSIAAVNTTDLHTPTGAEGSATPAVVREGSTLLVASSGGHLKELHALRPRLSLGGDVEWATFDTPQSRSLLAGETVHHVSLAGLVITDTTGRQTPGYYGANPGPEARAGQVASPPA